jgi:hypothetical protein
MARQIDVDQNDDHVGGNFEWELKPKCSCGRLEDAVDDRFIFVSNFTDDGFNQFYFLPVDADGFLAKSSGIPISNCPWCGDEIKTRKKYPKS